MALPNYIQKTLKMKPEVTKIFEDLEAWHDQCRFELIAFNPKDLYKSKEWRDYSYRIGGERKQYHRKESRPQRSE